MKVSAILTIHNRTPEVSKQVADSLMLPGNTPDELVIVLDRPTTEVKDGAHAAYDRLICPIRWITIPGEPGWRSPVKAWNLGFLAASGDVLYCFSSETLQAAGNLDKAKEALRPPLRYDTAGNPSAIAGVANPGYLHDDQWEPASLCLHGKVLCSCGPDGQEVNWGGQAPGNLFCDAAHPRPLGFIWAAPAWAVKQIGGYDEGFADGYWYDDNCFFYRLWRAGLDFVFDDSISGTHLHHGRLTLDTPEGQAGILRNQRYMIEKYRSLDPLYDQRGIDARPGRTVWRHL